MKRSIAVVIATLGLAGIALGGLASCRQGEGERCQIQEDCEEGLVCNQGEQRCRTTSSSSSDADPIPDAAIDASM